MSLGSSLEGCKVAVCGKAERIVVTGAKTVITKGQGKAEDIEKRIRQLKILAEMSRDKKEKDSIHNRIANLAGGIAVIQVGGTTEIEIQETKYRVEDGVNAAQTAVKSGILPGGGKAAWWVAQILKGELAKRLPSEINDGQTKGYEIVIKAMEEPMRQILRNANVDYSQTIKSLNHASAWTGFDIIGNRVTHLLEAGIVDPTLAVITALRNSVSSASMFMTCESLIGEGLFTKSKSGSEEPV
jgi:chaperonin GroEL